MPRPEANNRIERLGKINFPIEHRANEQKANIAILLPGQDVQKPGMLDEVVKHPSGKEVIDRADKLLVQEFGFKISEIANNQDLLKRTEYTQPAVFALSIALNNINKHEGHGKHKEGYSTLPSFITGNSMGMVTAVTLSGALSFEDGLRLIAMRGKIMQEFSDPTPTAMKATLNASEEQVRTLLDKYSDIDMCLINSDSVFVYGGPLESLGKMTEELKEQKIKVLDVNTDRAMHSRYTTPARKEFDKYIDSVNFQTPTIPIVGTLTRKPIVDVQGIKDELKYGFDNTFDNRKILNFLHEEEIPTFSEVNEKGSLSKSMERMYEAIEEHKLEAAIGALAFVAATGFGIYRIVTRHHRNHPGNVKK